MSHKYPSANCWIPKSKGIRAKTNSGDLPAFLTAAMPMEEITTPPAKLAPAEKHILFPFQLKVRRVSDIDNFPYPELFHNVNEKCQKLSAMREIISTIRFFLSNVPGSSMDGGE
jgi:hypothetical protein